MTETAISGEARLITIKPTNYKRTFCKDIVKIILISIFSMVFLISNYVWDQKSIKEISNIDAHLHYLHNRPSCVRFNLLFLINQIYDNNDCHSGELMEEYQKKIQRNEEIIFKTDLPWGKLKNYQTSFQQINYHDLCVGIFESQNEFKEIIGTFVVFGFCFHFYFFMKECHEIKDGILGHGLKEIMLYFSNYSSEYYRNEKEKKEYDHLTICFIFNKF